MLEKIVLMGIIWEQWDADQFIVIPWYTEVRVEYVIEYEEVTSRWSYESENIILQFLKTNVGFDTLGYSIIRFSLISSDVYCTVVCTRYFGEPLISAVLSFIRAKEDLLN